MEHDRDSVGSEERSDNPTTGSDDRAGDRPRASEPPPAVGVYDRPEGQQGGLSAARWLDVVLVIAVVAVAAFLLLQFVF